MTNKNDVTVVRSTAELPVRQAGREAEFVRPSTDVYETSEAYVITIDMPGVPKDAVHVTMDQNSLVVKGTVGERYGEKSTILFAELQKNGYYRVFNLGDGIDRNSIDARYEEGVLTVRLLKKEETKPRQIAIQ
jgi:HSP20 family protein